MQDLVTSKTIDMHVSLLKPFIYDAEHVDPATVALSDQESFLVEKIIIKHKGKRKYKSTLRFFVKWIGYSEPTWESWKNLRHNVHLHNYLRASPTLKSLVPKQYNTTQSS